MAVCSRIIKISMQASRGEFLLALYLGLDPSSAISPCSLGLDSSSAISSPCSLGLGSSSAIRSNKDGESAGSS